MVRLVAVIGLTGVAVLGGAALLGGASDANRDGCVDLQDYAILQNDFSGPGCGQHATVYLTVALPFDGQYHTIGNPRADVGEVFYITDAWSDKDDAGLYIYLPPEFTPGTSPGRWLYWSPLFPTQHFSPPIPFSTSLGVQPQEGGPEPTGTVVLVGYYSSAQPVIEVLALE